MKVAYERFVNPDEVLDRLGRLAPKTVIFDVEPLVAFWDTDQAALSSGVETILQQVRGAAADVEAVVFATNSSRRLRVDPPAARYPTMRYLADAAKPLRTAPYLDLPRPGVVVGDQVATDGLLAWRLGYSFFSLPPTPQHGPGRSTDHEPPGPSPTTGAVHPGYLTPAAAPSHRAGPGTSQAAGRGEKPEPNTFARMSTSSRRTPGTAARVRWQVDHIGRYASRRCSIRSTTTSRLLSLMR